MANAEHLEILKSGVENWNEWRMQNNDVTPDLSGADLSGANLPYADLSGANLFSANLYGAHLFNANLYGAHLFSAHLFSANLSGASLNGASLSGARLTGANLTSADLTSADLTRANLAYANLTSVNLTSANLTSANLTSANLTSANLTRANLTSANFTKSKFENPDFSDCLLSETVFGLTNLSICIGLESVKVAGPCVIDFPTLRASKNLPKEFLTKLGIPDLLMEYLPEFYNPALMIYPAFLSHSWNDKVFVRKLYEAITRKGVTVWLDEKQMKPGDNIHDSISEGIKYYDKLILVCSENSLTSWWVEKELERVYEKERELQKEQGKKYRLVIPIRIDDSIFNCTDGILGTIKGSLIGDFTRWQDEQAFERAVKELVDALNANRVDIKPPSFL